MARGVCSWACVVGAELDVAAASRAAEGFAVHEIAPGNYVHYGVHEERSPGNLGDQANIGFIVGDRCVAVSTPAARCRWAERCAQRSGASRALPVCYVILTHVHPDHVLGAAAFLADQPQFVGHAQLPRALAARGKFYQKTLQRDLGELAEGSEVVSPDAAGRRTRWCSTSATGPLRVRAWPVAHTDNDLTVYDEKTGTLWLSDLLFVDHTPVVDGSILGFLAVLEQLRAMPAEHFVPGHGRTDLPWPAALDPQVRYLEVIVHGDPAGAEGQEDHPGGGGHGRGGAGEELGQLRPVPSPQRDRCLHRAGMGIARDTLPAAI